MQINKNREYLKYLEKIGDGKINWIAWDRLIEETKKLIELELLQRNNEKKHTIINGNKKESSNNKNEIKLYLYNPNGEMIGVYDTFYQYGKENYYNYYTNLKMRLFKYGDIITKGNLLSYSQYNQDKAKEIYEKKSKIN